MAELSDIANEFARGEIDEFIENEDERKEIIDLYAAASPDMQDIAATVLEGDNDKSDELTKQALDNGVLQHFHIHLIEQFSCLYRVVQGRHRLQPLPRHLGAQLGII